MKNKLICAVALAGVVGTLASCGGGSSSKNLAIGVGMISAAPALSYGAPQLELNFATAIYEGDKVVASLVDVYQVPLSTESAAVDTSKDYATDTNVQTKRDRHDAYAMKETSANINVIEGGAEWWEQAAAFETYTEGKTTFAAEDTITGCTMQVGTLLEAVKEAKTNTKGNVSIASGSYTFALGHSISFGKDKETNALNQVNVTTIGLLIGSDSKIVTAYVDEIQIPLTFTAGAENPYSITEGKTQVTFDANQVVSSKKELGDAYAMKGTSAGMGVIEGGAEWWEQAAAWENYIVGKEVSALTAEDSVTGCTMKIGSYVAAAQNAVDSTLYNSKSITL